MRMIEKAKAFSLKAGRPTTYEVNDEMIELAVAVLTGEITLRQAKEAFDPPISNSSLSWRIVNIISEGVRSGKIVMECNK